MFPLRPKNILSKAISDRTENRGYANWSSGSMTRNNCLVLQQQNIMNDTEPNPLAS